MRVIITGATGTIGKHLLGALDADVTVLSREPERARQTIDAARFVPWDGRAPIAPSVFDGADAVFHLAGEPVASSRWTADKKKRVLESRVLGTRAVVEAVAKSGARPSLVCASAVGFYGDRGDETLTEASASGTGFLADVCKAWEAEASAATESGIRTTIVRIGVVLAREGGALHEMLPIFRLGLAGRLGSGAQWLPWIHVDDVVSILIRAGRGSWLEGPVNATSPHPVTNATFTKELARTLHRPAFLAVPTRAMRLVLGDRADVVLISQRVMPERALAAEYVFQHPKLEGALAHLLGRTPAPTRVEATS